MLFKLCIGLWPSICNNVQEETVQKIFKQLVKMYNRHKFERQYKYILMKRNVQHKSNSRKYRVGSKKSSEQTENCDSEYLGCTSVIFLFPRFDIQCNILLGSTEGANKLGWITFHLVLYLFCS